MIRFRGLSDGRLRKQRETTRSNLEPHGTDLNCFLYLLAVQPIVLVSYDPPTLPKHIYYNLLLPHRYTVIIQQVVVM